MHRLWGDEAQKGPGPGGQSPEGEISLDLTGRKPGRGAYVCRSAACLQAARKARRLERAFACAIPAEVYDRMEEELTSGD